MLSHLGGRAEGREEEMQGDTVPRSGGINTLAILAAISGLVGLGAGLLLLAVTLGDGGWGPPAGLVVLVLSVAELALAYGAWTKAQWAVRPGLRAIGFAVAIALILVGVGIVFVLPVSTSATPA
jgi:hypothetical protein